MFRISLIAVAGFGCTRTPATNGAVHKQVAVFSALGEPQAGTPVYRNDATGALVETAITDSNGHATLDAAPGDSLTVREVDSVANPMTSQLLTVVGFDDVTEIRLGGEAYVHHLVGQTEASIQGIADGVGVFVTSSCDATTLRTASPSAAFKWYDGCDSSTRMMIAATDEASPRYAVGNATGTDALTFATWSPLSPVTFALPDGVGVGELAIELFDGDHAVRRFFVENSNQPFGVPPIGQWRAQASLSDAGGNQLFWFAASDPTTSFVVADLPAPDSVDVAAARIEHTRTGPRARRTELAFGTEPCSDANLVWTVIDDGTQLSFDLPQVDPELASAQSVPLAAYTTTVVAGTDLGDSATIAQLAVRASFPGLDLISLATTQNPVTAAVHTTAQVCD